MQPDENFWKKCEGERIANAYELEQLLGCGAFGGVFRAARIANGKKLEKRVAVKLMLSGTIQLEELNFALDLPSDPNLVQHHAGNNVEIRGFPMFYLVMELADCSLADFVEQRGGRISSVEAKAIVRDVAQGLKFLHELDAGNSQDKRYVHRDLKLLNVLQVGGVWKIADFGLSKALDRGTMQASKVAGTPYYMPPELFRNGYVSTKWDVWSLGVMIVEMLTGHFPFEAVYQDELERKIQRENPNLQGVSSEWLDIAKGCLTRDHNRRWAAADVLEALDSIGVAIPKKQPPTIPQPKPSSQKTTPVHASPSRSNGLWGTAITIGLVSGVGFIIWQNMKSVNSPPIISSPSPTSTPSSEPLSVIPTITSSPSQNETVSSKTATDFFTDGLKKYNEKDFKGAIADYNKAILINPNLADAYGNRGNAKSALGDKQGAIADYNEAIDLNPNLSEAYYNRAPVQMELGNPQRAIDDYTEAIRLQPDFAGAYVGRGKASVALGYKRKIFQNLYIDILKDYSEAIRIKPDYGDAYNNRGMIKYQIKDYQGAIADYSQTILVEPDSPYPYRNRGTAKFALGDKQGAIDDFDKAIYLKPDYDLAYYNRGLVKKETGEVQEALADFRKALELYQQQGNTEWYNNSRDRIRELGG